MWNVEGLRGLMNKSPESELFDDADIIVATETLLVDECFGIPGYYSFIEPAPRPTMGHGIAIFSKPHLSPVLLSKSPHHVTVTSADMILVAFYFPPQFDIDDLIMEVADVVASLPWGNGKNVVVMGDFNCRLDCGDRGEVLQEVLRQQFALELRNQASVTTFRGPQGSSVIDLVFSRDKPLRGPVVQTSLDRRHCKVITTWRSASENETKPDPVRRTKRVDLETLATHPNLPHVQPLLEAGAISTATSLLTNSLLDSCQTLRNRKGQHHKPWFDDECKAKKREVQEAKSTDAFWERRRAYKRTCKWKRIQWEEHELSKKIEDVETAPWHLFKEKTTKSPAPVPIEAWEAHFTSLLNPERATPVLDLPPNQVNDELEDEWFNRPFSKGEVSRAISQLKDNKAAGPDSVKNELLKASVDILLPLWCTLLNACLKTGAIARQWRSSKLVAVFKGKGVNTDPGNYRGIALLCTMFKVLTRLLNWRMMPSIEHLLPPEQYGFRPERGTKDAIDCLLDYLKAKTRPSKGKAYAGFVDFEKAFDSLDRTILLAKLRDQFGVKGLVLRLIASILQWNSFRVFDGLRTSQEIRQHRGVLQGDSLSPTLFLTFIADLADALRVVPGLEFIFYADDLVFYAAESDTIRRGFHALESWCRVNKLKVNVRKTKVMKFRKAGRLSRDDNFTFNGETIELSQTYDYLGITLQPSLTFSKHLKRRKTKALAATGSLKNLSRVSISTAAKIYRMKIQPMITYSLELISPLLSVHQLQELDKAKAKFFKKALSIHDSSSSTMTLELTGEKTFVEDMKDQGLHFDDDAWNQYQLDREERKWDFVSKRYTDGLAFNTAIWKTANFKKRHLITRSTAHGFHHLMCQDKTRHEANEDICTCQLCERPASLQHINSCPARGNEETLLAFIERVTNMDKR